MDFSQLFGSDPNLSQVSATPDMNMGLLGTSMVGATNLTDTLPVSQGMDMAKMLAMLQKMNPQQKKQMMAQFLPAMPIQSGGGSFMPYAPGGMTGLLGAQNGIT